MATEVLQIKEAKELLSFAIAIVAATTKSLEDGKFEMGEIANYVPALMQAPTAFDGITVAFEELKNIDEAGLIDLKDFVLEQGKNIPGIEAKWLEVARGALLVAQGLLVAFKSVKV